MLTFGIRYLQGVAVGSHGEHGRVEWLVERDEDDEDGVNLRVALDRKSVV